MHSSSGLVGPALSGSRLEAYDASAVRIGSGLLIAVLLHTGFLIYAYLRPMPPVIKRSRPIVMEVLTKPKPPAPPPEVLPPPPSTPNPSRQPASRPLPRELQPVPRKDETPDPRSSAIVVPVQPAAPPEAGPPGMPKGPIDLFPKNLGAIVGGPAPGAAIPKGPDRLFKDERLEEKKEPPFEIVPEKGGGFKCETPNFVAHIKPDGALSFDNRFPIGFQKGGTFTFDLTDLAMRGKKQDPYAAEKRRFIEFSDKLRSDLRKKALQEYHEQALTTLAEQLSAIWGSSRSAAARRRELYEKWADCSDDGSDHLGRKGRHAVEDFIRGHLPKSGPDGYTDEELGKIAGERQGLPPFDPYGQGAP
jgi:hypothetical protein